MVALEEAISRRSPGGGDHGAAGVVVVEHVDATIRRHAREQVDHVEVGDEGVGQPWRAASDLGACGPAA